MWKGINTDLHPSNLSLGEYLHAKNVILTDKIGSFKNESGTKLSIDTESVIIGHLSLNNQVEIIFSVSEGDSYIGIADFNKKTYTIPDEWVSKGLHTYLGFDPEYPIKTAVHYFDNGGQLFVVFSDNHNPIRLLKLGTISAPTVTTLTTLDDANLFPNQDSSEISTTVITGNLVSGVYVLGYLLVDSQNVEFGNISTTLPILIDDTEFGIDDGNITGEASSKGIQMSITKDTDFKGWRPIVIRVVGNVPQVFIGPMVVTNTYSILSLTDWEEYTLEEAVASFTTFTKAKALTVDSNRLYAGNIEELEDIDIDLQTATNSISIRYRLVPRAGNVGRRTFAHGEVYAFYARYQRVDGTWSKAYPIVGPVQASGFGTITVSDSNGGTVTVPRWKLLSTCTKLTAYTGVPGYWENDNESYPDDFGIVHNVRHHRMPDFNFVMTQHATDAQWIADYGANSYPNIALDAIECYAVGVSAPTGYQAVEILYAERTYENSIVVGVESPIYPIIDATEPDSLIASTGNYIHQIPLSVVTTLNLTRKTDWHILQGLDLLTNKPNLDNTFMLTQMKMNVDTAVMGNTGTFQGYFQAYDNGNVAIPGQSLMIWDYLGPQSAPAYTSDYDLVKLGQYAYLQNNVIADGESGIVYVNFLGPECVMVKGTLSTATSTSTPVVCRSTFGNMPNDANSTSSIPDNNELFLTIIFYLKSDCYFPYNNQNLVHAGYIVNPVSLTEYSLQGDSWNGFSNKSLSAYGRNSDSNYRKGIKAHYRVLYEGRSNENLKYETASQYSKYYPKTGTSFVIGENRPMIEEMKQWDISNNVNVVNYDRTYSRLNDFRQTGIWDGIRRDLPFTGVDDVGKFPFRIRRSEPIGDTTGWRLFKPLEYYEMPKYKGPIVNLQTIGDKMVIHTENSLFLTRGKVKVAFNDLSEAILGSNDIFDIEPQEVSPENEGVGTKSQLSCTVTPAGYFFVDDTFGKVYRLTNTLSDISIGLRDFLHQELPFRQTIVTSETVSVPFELYDSCGESSFIQIPMTYGCYDLTPLVGTYTINGDSVEVVGIRMEGFYYVLSLDTTLGENGTIDIVGYMRTHEVYYPDNTYLDKGYTIGHDLRNNRILVTKNAKDAEFYFNGTFKGILPTACTDIYAIGHGDVVIEDGEYKRVTTEGLAQEGDIAIVFGCVECEAGFSFPGNKYVVDVSLSQPVLTIDNNFDDADDYLLGIEYSINGGPWIATTAPSTVIYDLPRGVVEIATKYSFDLEARCKQCIFVCGLEEITSDSFTLSYSLDLERWASFHDFVPNLIFSNKRELHSSDNGIIYSHDNCINGLFYGQSYQSTIDFLFKSSGDASKWTSVYWASDAKSSNNIPTKDVSIDWISLRNHLQSTGDISVREVEAKYNYGIWSVSSIRDTAVAGKQIVEELNEGFDLTQSGYEEKRDEDLGMIVSPYCIVKVKMESSGTKITIYKLGATETPIKLT